MGRRERDWKMSIVCEEVREGCITNWSITGMFIEMHGVDPRMWISKVDSVWSSSSSPLKCRLSLCLPLSLFVCLFHSVVLCMGLLRVMMPGEDGSWEWGLETSLISPVFDSNWLICICTICLVWEPHTRLACPIRKVDGWQGTWFQRYFVFVACEYSANYQKKKARVCTPYFTRPYRLPPRWSMVKHPHPFTSLTPLSLSLFLLVSFLLSYLLFFALIISLRYSYPNEPEPSQKEKPELDPGHHVRHLGKIEIEERREIGDHEAVHYRILGHTWAVNAVYPLCLRMLFFSHFHRKHCFHH